MKLFLTALGLFLTNIVMAQMKVDALKKGFEILNLNIEETKILLSEKVKIHLTNYQCILYSYKDKKRIVLYTPNSERHKNLTNGKYYFRIYDIN